MGIIVDLLSVLTGKSVYREVSEWHFELGDGMLALVYLHVSLFF